MSDRAARKYWWVECVSKKVGWKSQETEVRSITEMKTGGKKTDVLKNRIKYFHFVAPNNVVHEIISTV